MRPCVRVLRRNEVEKRVVERSQIGRDLLLDVARQEAELLARLHRRTRQDQSIDIALTEVLHGVGDGQIGLAGSAGADAEDDLVLAHGLEISGLATRLGPQRLAPVGVADDVVEDLVDVLIGADLLGQVFDLTKIGHVVAADQVLEFLDELEDVLNVTIGPLDDETVAARIDVDVEPFANRLQIAIERPQERRRLGDVVEDDLALGARRIGHRSPLPLVLPSMAQGMVVEAGPLCNGTIHDLDHTSTDLPNASPLGERNNLSSA